MYFALSYYSLKYKFATVKTNVNKTWHGDWRQCIADRITVHVRSRCIVNKCMYDTDIYKEI